MKNLARTLGIITAFAITVFAGTKNVYAEGLVVTSDKETCEIGDKIVVTVDAAKVGDGNVPPDIQVEFDARRLNFETCSVEYGGGGGGLVTFKDKKATVEFTTLSGGDASVTVSATAEDAAGPESASVTISVNGEDTAAAAGDDLTSTGVASGSIDIGEGRSIQNVFADEFMPILFHKDTIDYNGQTVECAKFDMGDMTLLYTTDSSGADGKFMIYDSATGEMSDFRMIQGIENRFIIVLSDCEGPIPAGYTKAVLEWNGQTLTAFMEESVAAGTAAMTENGINPSDFFLVYAVSSEGNKGWYRYDKNEGTYQRFIVDEGASDESPEGEEADADSDSAGLLDEYIPHNIQSILVLVCAPFAVILLVVVIILAVKLRDYADELDAIYEDGYYEDEEEDDEEEQPRRAAPGAVTAASLVGRSMSDEEDDEDEEDEDEEDDEDDEEEDVNDEDEGDEEDDEDEEEDDDEDDDEEEMYSRPLTRREQRELAREEKWRLKEEKKAAKRRAKGYEEATPMDWSAFEKDRDEDVKIAPMKKSKPPKYMTESMEVVKDDESDMMEEEVKRKPLPPRKKVVMPEETEKPHAVHEEDQREKQRRLFEQQQRIEEQRGIEKEREEQENLRQQQQFIAGKTDELDLDEDFQFEFLDLN
ncbi:MAG: hypothetical protein K6G67_08800 [Lachnospiraceae bacterium]|nr:hypothetical protein [Lachnospiraceae bacterium]